MYVRSKRSVGRGGSYDYLQLVRSYREGGRVRQQVLATLGRRDQLIASGGLDALLVSLARFSEQLQVVKLGDEAAFQAEFARVWGPALVFGHLWRQQGVPEVLAPLARERGEGAEVERAAFALVLQRLSPTGLALEPREWSQGVEAAGLTSLGPADFMRAEQLLGAHHPQIEDALRRRARQGAARGASLVLVRPASPSARRVLGVLVEGRGWPLAWSVLPCAAGQAERFRRAVDDLVRRFPVSGHLLLVGAGTGASRLASWSSGLTAPPVTAVRFRRLRAQPHAAEAFLSRTPRMAAAPGGLRLAGLALGAETSTLCFDPRLAEQDAEARERHLARLQHAITHDRRRVLARRAKERFLAGPDAAPRIDRAAVALDERLDGIVLGASEGDLTREEIGALYRGYRRVEDAFRPAQALQDLRRVQGRFDRRAIGRIVARFLGLRLRVELEARLADRGVDAAWPDIQRDLARLQSVRIELEGKPHRLRTSLRGLAPEILRAAGVRTPPALAPLPEAPGA